MKRSHGFDETDETPALTGPRLPGGGAAAARGRASVLALQLQLLK